MNSYISIIASAIAAILALPLLLVAVLASGIVALVAICTGTWSGEKERIEIDDDGIATLTRTTYLAGRIGGKQLVIQHRQELVDQNLTKFRRVNPKAKVGMFTATPERSDKKGLRGIFSNVCDTVTIRELVQLGFLREHENDGAAKKTKAWLDQPATGKQIELLNRFGYQAQVDLLGQSDWTKYSACCHMEFQFNRRNIEAALGVLQ